LAACGATSSSASSSGGTTPSGKKRFVVWATHVYYNQPALIGISVGFHDFLDPVGWKFQVTAARTSDDVAETIQAQQQALQLHPDAIVATMTDPTSFNHTFKSIVDAGIYLQLNNTQPPNGNSMGLPYIGQDFSVAGTTAITTVLDAAVAAGKKSGSVLLGYCCGNKGAVGTRTAGQLAGLTAYNQAHGTSFKAIQLLDTSDTDPASALGTWKAKLTQVGGSIVGMVCDQVGDPSIQAAIALGKKPGFVPIVTFDVTSQRLNYVEQGWLNAIVDQQPYAQGYIAAAQAFMWLEAHTQPPAIYNTGSALITKDHVTDVRNQQTYITQRASQLGIKV
jgi:ABC-type sugar transport system substrate-binding protein